MTVITRKVVADKLAAYLRHELTLDGLVSWAESAMMDGEFDPATLPTVRDVVARIGLAGVRALGLTWEDCGASRQTTLLPDNSFSDISPKLAIPPWLHNTTSC